MFPESLKKDAFAVFVWVFFLTLSVISLSFFPSLQELKKKKRPKSSIKKTTRDVPAFLFLVV